MTETYQKHQVSAQLSPLPIASIHIVHAISNCKDDLLYMWSKVQKNFTSIGTELVRPELPKVRIQNIMTLFKYKVNRSNKKIHSYR